MRDEIQSSDYYLGRLVGEIIFLRYLPTLEVDCLKSYKIINISSEEKLEEDRLHQLLNDTYSDDSDRDKWGHRKTTEIAHKNWIGYINKLGEKYLPEKIQCRFERIQILDKAQFKAGLVDYLWNTDMSWYMPDEDFWVETDTHCWYSEVIITREIS